jgi:hypothetical protein
MGAPCELRSQHESQNFHHAAVHEASEKIEAQLVWGSTLFKSLRHEFDPLDREILERAFAASWAAVKGGHAPMDFDSDEGLEAILRRELLEIAGFNGVNDPEALRDILLARLPRGSEDRAER